MIQHFAAAPLCCITTPAWSASRSFRFLLRGVLADHQQLSLPAPLAQHYPSERPLLIVATAMTLVITTGGIDLSVGSTLRWSARFPYRP